jgi:hypothetical protein
MASPHEIRAVRLPQCETKIAVNTQVVALPYDTDATVPSRKFLTCCDSIISGTVIGNNNLKISERLIQ